MGDIRKHSATSNIVRAILRHSSTGAPLPGLAYNSSGLIISTIADVEASAAVYTVAATNVETITTLGTFAAPTASKCRFKEVDATNHPGLYEFQFADARFSVANAKRIVITWSGATNLLADSYEIVLDPAVDVNRIQGTVQTARDIGASVLLSAGTGTGQLDFTSGVVKSNLVQILGTVLTETAGQIAAAFKKFFDIASPTSTANRITLVDTTTANTDMRGTDNAALATDLATLLTRLSEARAGYLDWLNTGGLVASQSDIQGITQAQRVRVLPSPQMERPDSGSTAFRVWIYVYNELHQAEDLDANPTVTAENNAGTDRSANLGTVTKPGGTTGQYYVDYTVADTHEIEGLVFKVAAVDGAVTTNYAAPSVVTDTTAVDFTSADRAKLEALNTDWANGGRLDLLIDAILEDTGTTLPALMAASALRNALGLATANLDSQLTALLNLLEADMFIDVLTTPWKLRIRLKGTTTDLLVKDLKSTAGANIVNGTTIVGQEINAA